MTYKKDSMYWELKGITEFKSLRNGYIGLTRRGLESWKFTWRFNLRLIEIYKNKKN